MHPIAAVLSQHTWILTHAQHMSREEWEQLRFCPTESSSFMFLKVSSFAFQDYFFFFLSHDSSNVAARNKSNQRCGVPLHALNVSFPLQKLNPECSVVTSHILYVFVLFYIVWCCLSTRLLTENLHLLLGDHSGLCDVFSHMGRTCAKSH